MSLYDIGVVASILHGIVMILGYLAYTNIFSSIRLVADSTARQWFMFLHHLIPSLTLSGTVACWMSVVFQNQPLAVFFLVFPVGFAMVVVLAFLCSNMEERGPTNHEILHGSKKDYYNAYLSHVDFAHEMVERIDEYRQTHPGHELEHSPYLQRRLQQIQAAQHAYDLTNQ